MAAPKQLDLRVANRYQILHRLGKGRFAQVYLGRDLQGNHDEVALKLEHCRGDAHFLQTEADYYRDHLNGGTGIPRIYDYVQECDFWVLIMERLGPSLRDLRKYCRGQLGLKTVLMLADQLLHRLEFLHQRGLVHRDVSPNNFLLGTGRQGNTLYVVDLGLAVEWSSEEPPERNYEGARLSAVGTVDFASIDAHYGGGTARCDDLESLGYLLHYLLDGSLPWSHLDDHDRAERDAAILELKQSVTVDELCEDLPKAFTEFWDHVLSLSRVDKPDYAWLRRRFAKAFRDQGFEYDNVYDWTVYAFMQLHPEHVPEAKQDDREKDQQTHKNQKSKNQKSPKNQKPDKKTRKQRK